MLPEKELSGFLFNPLKPGMYIIFKTLVPTSQVTQ
jgi:hypothetical protein